MSVATTGRYVLSNLDPGIYRVNVYAPGFVADGDPNTDPAERNLFRVGDTASFRLVKGGGRRALERVTPAALHQGLRRRVNRNFTPGA